VIGDRIRQIDPTLLAIFGGALSAALALLPENFSILSFLLGYFASLPLYLIGLIRGRLSLAAFISFFIVAFVAGKLHPNLIFCLLFLSTTLAPCLLIVYRVTQGDSAGSIVSWVVGFMIALFLGVLLVLAAQSINVLDILQSWFSTFRDEANLPASQISSFLPSIGAISWMIMHLINALVAKKILVKLNLLPPNQSSFQEMPENWDIIMTISLILILTDAPLFAFIGKNSAIMSCIPLFLAGLNVVYTWLERGSNPQLWMISIIVASFLLVWPGIIIVMFGFLEPTLHLRKRWI
jgi:hypothetical protein